MTINTVETFDVTLKLPKDLAQWIKQAGILDDQRLAEWVIGGLDREERLDRLFADIENLHDVDLPLTMEEIDAEVHAVRAEKRLR